MEALAFTFIILCILTQYGFKYAFMYKKYVPYLKYVSGIVCYVLLLTIISYWNGSIRSLHELGTYWGKILFVFLIAYLVLSIKDNEITFYCGLKNLSWILIFFGIIERITRSNLLLQIYNVASRNIMLNEGRISSIFLHPLVYACYLTILFIIEIYMPYKSKIIHLIYLFFVTINLLFTGSRAGIVAIGGYFIFLIIKNLCEHKIKIKQVYNKNSVILFIFVTALGVLLLITNFEYIFGFFNEFINRLSKGLQGRDQQIRLTVMKNYRNYFFSENIIHVLIGKGAGYSHDFMKLNHINGWDSTTDNMYITMLLDFGIPGLLFLISQIIFALKILLSDENKKMQAVLIIILSIEIFFFEGLYWPVIGLIYFIVLGQLRYYK